MNDLDHALPLSFPSIARMGLEIAQCIGVFMAGYGVGALIDWLI